MAKIQYRKIKSKNLQQLLDDKAVSNYALVYNDGEKNFAKEIFIRHITKQHDQHIFDVHIIDSDHDILLLVKRNKLDENLYFKDVVLERKLKSPLTLEDILADPRILNHAVFDHESVLQGHFQQVIAIFQRIIERCVVVHPDRLSIVHLYSLEKPVLLLIQDMNEEYFEEE